MNSIEVSTKEELIKAMKKGYSPITLKGEVAEEMERNQGSFTDPTGKGIAMAATGMDLASIIFGFLKELIGAARDFAKDYRCRKSPDGHWTVENK